MPSIFTTMVKNLASLFIIMAVGYLCRKIKVIDDRVSSGLSRLLLWVALPCTSFMSLQREFSYTLLRESVITLFAAFAIFLFGTLLGIIFVKLTKSGPSEGSVWKFGLTFPNVGYAGFPIMMAVYGQSGMIYTSMVNAAFNMLVYSLGIALYAGAGSPEPGVRKEQRARRGGLSRFPGSRFRALAPSREAVLRIALNPALIATVLGFVFFVCSLKPPEVVGDSLNFLANLTTPLSMIIVGAILAKIDIRKAFTDIRIYFISLIKLAVIPLAAFAVLRLFVKNPVMLGVLTYLAAMPVGSITAIMAEERGGNSEAASKAVFVSTLLCMVTIPLISMVIQR